MKNFEAINKLINENFRLGHEIHLLVERFKSEPDPEILDKMEEINGLIDINREKISKLRK